ncbi:MULTISPECIES: DoxX family protein [unclassified Leifsonia]|uniref:DoxX family protein n=1 Tax=unclassified Leifsonia TaxID=2663824 RepID=UPI0006FD4059|nr:MULTISPECIES: DoxX family protein [unclassified Leifsonia]KQX07287.1 hypothetical protein ASC59_05750 [Leifsonia sp. Root1293]KRA11570.1 hypothetical protein ASD61_05750 [Leifsonia sp. Root60]
MTTHDIFEIAQWVVRILLAIVFVGMGVNHFRPGAARIMAKMIPPRMRREGLLAPVNLVRFTGVCEIAGGIGLLIPATQFAAGILLAVFLVAVFPANVYAARHPEIFRSLSIPLVPRSIAQIVLIGLCVFAAV